MNKKTFFKLDYYSEHIFYNILGNKKDRKILYKACNLCSIIGSFSKGINLRYSIVNNNIIIYFFDDFGYQYSFNLNDYNYIEQTKGNKIGKLYCIDKNNNIKLIMEIYNLDYINIRKIYYYEDKNNLILIYKDYYNEYKVHLVYNNNIKINKIDLSNKNIVINNYNEFINFINYYYNLDKCLNIYFNENNNNKRKRKL